MRNFTLLLCCLFFSIAFAQPGSIDFSFNTGTGPDAAVLSHVTQPDGKVLIGGFFQNYNGTVRNGIARINADGSLDDSFDPGTGLALSTELINCITLQTDGKILVGGGFATFNGMSRNNIVRLNADGSVDTSFDPGTGTNNEVVTISIQSTGKIIVGGLFTQFNSAPRNRIIRLNTDGTFDSTFLIGTGANSYVWTSSVLPDDRIYVGGGFSAFNGANANHIIRLNANGTRDASFTALRFTNNAVLAHAVQPDGKIIIGGYFTNYGGTSFPRNRLARINYNGTLDNTFNVGTGLDDYPLTIVCQPNGKILVGGAFLTYNGNNAARIMRLNSDATVDASFLAGTGMNNIFHSATFESDGKLILSGEASVYNGNTTRPFLVKVNAYADNSIETTTLSATSPFCVEQTFNVNYTADGYYAAGNTFTAQLSNASGSFAAPVTIGSVNATTSGTIPVTIPLETTVGAGYRIRVVSSNILFIGTDNGFDLAISAPTTYYLDADGDGYGNPAVSQVSCAVPVGYSTDNSDCNDLEATANPGTGEMLYDGIDNNCDGQLDEGFQITTQLLAGSCGTTLAAMGSLVRIQIIAPASTITGWRIRATKGAEVQTLETIVPHFTMPQFALFDYAATYTIEVELQRNGVWLGYYGPACFVSTPAILANGGAGSVNPSQCNTTLAQINTVIATTSLPHVTGYRFQITNLTDPLGQNAVQTLDRTQNWFTLQMLTRYNYGTTYRIEVAVKSTGNYGAFGSPCEINSPAIPGLTTCGTTIASTATLIKAASVAGATQYRFQLKRQSDNASSTVDRNTNYFTLDMVPGIYTAGAVYNVRVAVFSTGNWSPFGNVCEITAPAGMSSGIPTIENESVSALFNAIISPNPFTTNFNIDVLSSGVEKVELKVYDMLGRLMESTEIKTPDNNNSLGNSYPSGVYTVIVSQGDTVKTLRVIKR